MDLGKFVEHTFRGLDVGTGKGKKEQKSQIKTNDAMLCAKTVVSTSSYSCPLVLT
jgi:hypothetical protein